MTLSHHPLGPARCPAPRAAIGAFLLVWLVWASFTAGEPAVRPAAMQRIEGALAEGRPRDAETLARELIRERPGYAEAHGALARALEAQGRDAEALAVLLQVGQGLAHSNLPEEGAAYLARAVELAPRSAAAHAALGHALLGSRAYRSAAERLERAMELGERGLAVRIYLGSALWESGEPDRAEAVLREALDLDRSLPALQTLGGLLVWRGAYDEAIELLEEARASDPSSLPLQLDLGRALAGAGRTERAIRHYRALAETYPETAEVRYALARLLQQEGDADGAAAQLEAFRRLHEAEQRRTHETSLLRATLDAGWERLRQGRLDEAAESFSSLPPSPDSLSGLAAVQCARGDHRAEVRTLERALAQAPDRIDLKLKLARARLAAAS